MSQRNVLQHIPPYPGVTAREIAKIVRCDKRDANRILYSLHRNGLILKVDNKDRPPTFCQLQEKKADYACPRPLSERKIQTQCCLFVDAGNKADLLGVLDRYFQRRFKDEKPLLPVYVFADKHYNGIGVNPLQAFKCPQWFILHHCTSQYRNAADIRLIRQLFSFIDTQDKQPKNIAVVTADGQWAEIQNICKEEGHEIDIISSAPHLLAWIEKVTA